HVLVEREHRSVVQHDRPAAWRSVHLRDSSRVRGPDRRVGRRRPAAARAIQDVHAEVARILEGLRDLRQQTIPARDRPDPPGRELDRRAPARGKEHEQQQRGALPVRHQSSSSEAISSPSKTRTQPLPPACAVTSIATSLACWPAYASTTFLIPAICAAPGRSPFCALIGPRSGASLYFRCEAGSGVANTPLSAVMS